MDKKQIQEGYEHIAHLTESIKDIQKKIEKRTDGVRLSFSSKPRFNIQKYVNEGLSYGEFYTKIMNISESRDSVIYTQGIKGLANAIMAYNCRYDCVIIDVLTDDGENDILFNFAIPLVELRYFDADNDPVGVKPGMTNLWESWVEGTRTIGMFDIITAMDDEDLDDGMFDE